MQIGKPVAIKILPTGWLDDPDRRARFDREARVLAALNHPQIATIHGLADADGRRGLVLELVEGETLAERLARGPLPLTRRCGWPARSRWRWSARTTAASSIAT